MPIQQATNSYARKGKNLVGGCTWTSKDLALTIERIIHSALPHMQSKSISIVAGNCYANELPTFPEDRCKEAVLSLREIRSDTVSAPYHVWLEIDDTIIDLTILHSMLPKGGFDGMFAQPIYYHGEYGTLPYELNLRYQPIARFLPPQSLKSVDFSDRPDIGIASRESSSGKERDNFRGSIKRLTLQWRNSVRKILRK
ncbi:hypothetical protein D3C80_1183910 [compost metagenome]